MTPLEAVEAMEIIKAITENQDDYVGIFHARKGALVEWLTLPPKRRYRQFRGKTLLDALRKAKAAWEEGK